MLDLSVAILTSLLNILRLFQGFLRLLRVTIQLLGCWTSALLQLRHNLMLTLQKFMPILASTKIRNLSRD
ncbi:hypothetical protein CsSME_00009738 [Camellia sinensis var. sinensis]